MDIVCSEKRMVVRERSLRESPKQGYCVYYPSQILFVAYAVLKYEKLRYSSVLAGECSVM